MACTLRLSQLPAGSRAEVRAISGHAMFRSRMLALGITPGSPVRVIRQMPLGGPLEIEVRGTTVALRLRDADQITVRLHA